MDPNSSIHSFEAFFGSSWNPKLAQAIINDPQTSARLKKIVEDAHCDLNLYALKPGYIEMLKASLIGGNGQFQDEFKALLQLPPTEKASRGVILNGFRKKIESLISDALTQRDAAALTARLGPPVDPTLPAPDAAPGLLHPLTRTRREVCALFRKIGFTIAEGPELETEWFNFDALNTPPDHPARNEQDTFYLPAATLVGNVSRHGHERYLLRSHTSTVQIRTLLKEKPPLRILAPGRVFRRDNVDATHSANFHQVEGLCVDRRVTVVDLKAALDYLVRGLFGAGAQIRLRPSFFPFTEPSFEMDFTSPDLGKLSGKWLELGGCGVVDPEVFNAVGLNPAE